MSRAIIRVGYIGSMDLDPAKVIFTHKDTGKTITGWEWIDDLDLPEREDYTLPDDICPNGDITDVEWRLVERVLDVT